VIKSFRDLDIYKESIELAVEVEEFLRLFPKHEQFLSVDQMRRASRGIPPLIAEGYAKRDSLRTFQKYLKDALGEANEMMAHLELADRLGYIKRPGYAQKLIERYDRLGKKIANLRDNWHNY
jgi:four helix bundle protein